MRNNKSEKLFVELNDLKKSREMILTKGKLYRPLPFYILLFSTFGFLGLVFGSQLFSYNLVKASTEWFVIGVLCIVCAEFLYLVLDFNEPRVKRKKQELLSLYSIVKLREKELEALED